MRRPAALVELAVVDEAVAVMNRVKLSYEGIGDVMRSPKVTKALRSQARKIAARAQQIASSENVRMDVRVEEGVRPHNRRPYARVTSPDVLLEFGGGPRRRHRVLGRAADVPIQ